MDIKEFKAKIFEKAAKFGFSDYEIYYEASKTFEIRVYQGEISQYKNASLNGVSFRGLLDGKMGYSYSERIDEEIIELLLKNAKENAEIIEESGEIIFTGSEAYPKVQGISERLGIPGAKQKIDWAVKMEEAALKADKRVEDVEYSVVSSVSGSNYIANSHGLELSQESGFSVAYVIVRVKEGNDVKTAYEIFRGRDFDGFDPQEIAEKAVQKAVSGLGAKPSKTGKYDIILKNDMAADLFDVFVGAFYGENVQKGFSLLKGKKGEKIASDIVNIKDVPLHDKSLVQLSFDSEGAAVQETAVVENGILKEYLYNLKSAGKEGKNSTGNGFKSSYKGSVSTAYANFYMVPSDMTYEELIKTLDSGIIITDLAGLHSGANPISGDFSLLAEGFLVEGGKIVRPVEQITVASNFYDLLKNIKGLGSDLRFEMSGAGGMGMPSMLIKDISVSGI